jgi:glutamate carboxypeptidase
VPDVGDRIVADLGVLVACESPSADPDAIDRVVDITREIAESWIGTAGTVVRSGGRPHLQWHVGGDTKVLLLGHVDTVWPMGTIDRWPFGVDGDRATGPGVFDMKAGVIQLFAALNRLDDLDGLTVLLTTDEEVGSQTSRAVIEDAARRASAVLVLEPSSDGALKLERKGISTYEFTIRGRAAHAGLRPEAGVNSVVEAAYLVQAALAQTRWDLGTTVTPTLVRGGTTINTVPASTSLGVDVRAGSLAEQERVDGYFRRWTPVVPGAEVTVEGGINRPPLDRVRSERLFDLAARVAEDCGLPALRGVAVGGGSDGNFTAALGVETLDGLGAVGDHAHAEGEWASIAAIGERAQLVAGLVERIRAG